MACSVLHPRRYPMRAPGWEGDCDYSPTAVPKSRELSTLIERSGLTLPMIWTPLPAERCASWYEWGE